MNAIICPHCKKNVEISEAFAHQFRDEILKEMDGKHKQELEKIRLEAEERATKRAKEEIEYKLKRTEEESEEMKDRNKKLQEQLSELFKELRDLKQKDGERDLEMKKQLLKERELMEIEIKRIEADKARLEKLELQKQLDDTKKALEDAQRKANQSSQQLQGEVLELDLEQQLATEFTTDEVMPVPKGITGADIIQKVKNRHGQTGGSILWETKRTKDWSNLWLGKLREEVRTLGASCAIIVSEALPQGVDTFALIDGVWVTSYRYAIPLACVLRDGILRVAIAKAAAANKDEKLEMLYQYLTDSSFKHRFEAQVEAIIELRSDLEAEQRSMTRLWKKKEIQIQRMTKNIASLYGELQGILGSALPSLPGLEFESLGDGMKSVDSGLINPAIKARITMSDSDEKNDSDPKTLF